MLMTVFININKTVNNLMFNIRETIYKEKVIGKNVQDILQVILINQSAKDYHFC